MPEYTEYCTCFYEPSEKKVFFYDEIKERTIGNQKVQDTDEAVSVMQRWVCNAPEGVICECLDKIK